MQTVKSIILNKVSDVKDLESIQGMHLITDLAIKTQIGLERIM